MDQDTYGQPSSPSGTPYTDSNRAIAVPLANATITSNNTTPAPAPLDSMLLPQENSQTQAETQPDVCDHAPEPEHHIMGNKRTRDEESDKAAKKIKVSVGPAVDLGD